MNHLQPELELYVHSMGKALRVTGIFTSIEDANAAAERDRDRFAVVACTKGDNVIFTADRYDSGRPMPRYAA